MKTDPPDYTLPPDDAPMATRSGKKRQFYFPANVTNESQWQHGGEKTGKGNGTFVALLLLHLFGVGGLIAFNYLGKDANRKKEEATPASQVAPQNAPKAKIVADTAETKPRQPESQPRNYQVQPGDSWAGLAAVRGITESQLRGANPGIETLFVGQAIHLPNRPLIITEASTLAPKARPVTETPEPPIKQHGHKFALNDAKDALRGIPVPGLPSGNRFPQTPVPNPQDPPPIPEPPPALNPPPLPIPTPEATAPRTDQGYGTPQQATGMAPKKTFIIHDVQKGDTVFSLAKKYKMTVDEFMVVNGLRDTNIRAGQTLKAKAGSTQ